MKKMKRFVALALSVVMVLAMSVMAFADSDDATININGGDKGSEYAAYRLLNLTTSTTDSTTNYAYTLNTKYETILKNVTGKTTEKTTEKEIVDYISALSDTETRTFADNVYAAITANSEITADATTTNDKFENVPQGYYLIAETKVGTTTGSTSLVMLNTAGKDTLNINTKEDVPEVEKKVKDTNDSTGTTSGWQDSADADIGDELEYQLTGTVSEKIGNYKTYYYEFVDTMTHLTYVEGSVKVEIVNEGEAAVDVTKSFATNWTKPTLSVKCDDLIAIANNNNATLDAHTKVVVTYKATLDSDATIGSTGNPNEVSLKYSNNPYADGDGTKNTGETPKDKNIVFTYKTVINKTDGTKPLTGAEFTLYKFVKSESGTDTYKGKTGTWVLKSQDTTTSGSTFTFSGLDDGEYRLRETKAPDGYNKLTDDIYFAITAEHTELADNPELTKLSGSKDDGTIDINFTASIQDGSLSADVVNHSGTELPSTGGIGTTIFYIVGGILMVGAAVLLITKRRAEN